MSTILPPANEALARVRNELFVGAPDAAVVIGASIDVIYAGLREGTIPCVRLGQRYRIPTKWIREQALLDQALLAD